MAAVRIQGRKGQCAWGGYKSQAPLFKAELNYTSDSSTWFKRQWNTVPAELKPGKHEVWATLPKSTTAYYFNLVDDRGIVVSSDLQILDAAAR